MIFAVINAWVIKTIKVILHTLWLVLVQQTALFMTEW